MFKSIDVKKKYKTLDKKRKMEYANKILTAIKESDTWAMDYYAEQVKKPFTFSVKYYPRLNLFKSSSRKLIFNPETGLATSYDWYNIAQVINGIMILNSYGYSNTTSKHVWELRTLFRQLGVKYKEIEAPRGLQNLERAMLRHTEQLAKAMVKAKYGRNDYSGAIRNQRSKIKLIESISNVRFEDDTLQSNIEYYEKERADRLEEKRQSKLKEVA